jgi:Spx/MgsR family transcriptional regulator
MKKTFDWFDKNGLTYTFHDYKKEVVDQKLFTQLLKKYGVDIIINKKGITWKKLDPLNQAKANNLTSALELITEKPSMIKRPIVIFDKLIFFGWNEKEWEVFC